MYLNRTLIQYMHIQAIILPIYCMCTDSDYIYATHSEVIAKFRKCGYYRSFHVR